MKYKKITREYANTTKKSKDIQKTQKNYKI